MKIKKEELLSILNKLKPVSLKDDLLIENFLGQLIFSEEGISIFNDQTYIFYTIETDLNCIVSYTKLLNFITKTTGKFIKIIQTTKDKTEKVSLSCGKAKLSLNSLLLNEIDLETISEIKKTFVGKITNKIPEGFNEGITACSYSTSNDPAAGTLNCICIEGDTILGADRTRAGMFTMNSTLNNKSILISSKLISTLSKFKAIKFKVTEAWLIFKDEEDCLLAMRRIRGKYPFEEYSGAFSKFETKTKIEFPEEIKRIIDLITTMVSETTYDARFVHIKVEDNVLMLSSSSESAVIEEKMNIKYSDAPFVFSINPSALQQALNIVDSQVLEKDDRIVLMQSDNFKQLIALRVME